MIRRSKCRIYNLAIASSLAPNLALLATEAWMSSRLSSRSSSNRKGTSSRVGALMVVALDSMAPGSSTAPRIKLVQLSKQRREEGNRSRKRAKQCGIASYSSNTNGTPSAASFIARALSSYASSSQPVHIQMGGAPSQVRFMMSVASGCVTRSSSAYTYVRGGFAGQMSHGGILAI